MQDTTEIDLSHRANLSGLGQIGNGKGRGMLLQTVLAVEPDKPTVLGCMAQKPFMRVPAPSNEQRYQRRHREHRETDVWMQMVEQVGSLPTRGMVVHVGDRGADMFPFCTSLSGHSHPFSGACRGSTGARKKARKRSATRSAKPALGPVRPAVRLKFLPDTGVKSARRSCSWRLGN